ncbi:MAG: hypothetical protein ACK5LT_09005 [Lachnospirales bacterium]
MKFKKSLLVFSEAGAELAGLGFSVGTSTGTTIYYRKTFDMNLIYRLY